MQRPVLPLDLGADRDARGPGAAQSHNFYQVRRKIFSRGGGWWWFNLGLVRRVNFVLLLTGMRVVVIEAQLSLAFLRVQLKVCFNTVPPDATCVQLGISVLDCFLIL